METFLEEMSRRRRHVKFAHSTFRCWFLVHWQNKLSYFLFFDILRGYLLGKVVWVSRFPSLPELEKEQYITQSVSGINTI